MIIDLILDRKDGEPYGEEYSPREFYFDVLRYLNCFNGHFYYSESITRAMDYGNEDDVRAALCEYVLENEYNPAICDYINSRKWLESGYCDNGQWVTIRSYA